MIIFVSVVSAEPQAFLSQYAKTESINSLINNEDYQSRLGVARRQKELLSLIASHKTNLSSLKTRDASDNEIEMLVRRIDKVIDAYDRRELKVDNNTFYEVMMSVYAFGEKKTVSSPSSQRNAIRAIFNNVPLGGSTAMYYTLKTSNFSDVSDNKSVYYRSDRNKREVPLSKTNLASVKTGYYLQTAPGEFLAVLASLNIAIDFEFIVEEKHFRIADLVEDAKQYDIEGDMSYLLTGLSCYCQKISWTTRGGNRINVENILKHEIYRIKNVENAEMADCLYGIACARNHYSASFSHSSKAYNAAQLYLDYYIEIAFKNQTSDFGWSKNYFHKNVDVTDYAATVNMLSWLVVAVPQDFLKDKAFTRAVERVISVLEKNEKSIDLERNSLNQTKTMFQALRVLKVYNQRLLN